MPPSLESTALAPAAEDVLERLSRVAQRERAGLAAVARHEGLSPEEAVDCVQNALCTLLDLVQSGQIDAGVDPAPMLVTVVRNAARNQRRRHFRAMPHVELGTLELTDERATLAEELLSRAEEMVRLRACVAELCEIQRAVVTLRLLEERPGEDVAQALGVSSNHVAVLLHRAKSALRVCMTAGADDDSTRAISP
jgi:RNA polymerase sigma-70 factor, ECF subfamily